jgi:hypothetical protein
MTGSAGTSIIVCDKFMVNSKVKGQLDEPAILNSQIWVKRKG